MQTGRVAGHTAFYNQNRFTGRQPWPTGKTENVGCNVDLKINAQKERNNNDTVQRGPDCNIKYGFFKISFFFQMIGGEGVVVVVVNPLWYWSAQAKTPSG